MRLQAPTPVNYYYPSLNGIMNTRTFFTALVLLLHSACSDPVPSLPPLPADATILAFGDSLTYGTGTSAEGSYPAVLERLSGHTVINAGIPGEQTPAGLARLPHVLDEYEPQLLIVCHGGNDMIRKQPMATIQGNLEQMVRLAQARGVRVVLLGVPRPAILGLESAGHYHAVAEKMGVPLEADIIPEILSDSALKSDQIHPNTAGYRLLAEAVYRLLQQAGAL